MQLEVTNSQNKMTDKILSSAIQTQSTQSVSPSVITMSKRKINSTSNQQTVSSSASAVVQSCTQTVVTPSAAAASVPHSTSSFPPSLNTKFHQTNVNRSNTQIINSNRSISQRNIPPKNELPRKSLRGLVTTSSDENTGKCNSTRNRRQTVSSMNPMSASGGTRSKKEKLLCICRTPYDDTK